MCTQILTCRSNLCGTKQSCTYHLATIHLNDQGGDERHDPSDRSDQPGSASAPEQSFDFTAKLVAAEFQTETSVADHRGSGAPGTAGGTSAQILFKTH